MAQQVSSEAGPQISVVVPCLNEEDCLRQCIRSARSEPDVEVVVVDSGSQDETVRIAKELGVRVIEWPWSVSAPADEPGSQEVTVAGGKNRPTRADALNTGAKAARGDVLIFLHADTQLPTGYRLEVLACLEEGDRQGVSVVGAFRFKLAGVERRHYSMWTRLSLAAIEWGANIRSCFFSLPYGDQALFMRRAVYEELGRFPCEPFMEDLEFVDQAWSVACYAVQPVPLDRAGLESIESDIRSLVHGAPEIKVPTAAMLRDLVDDQTTLSAFWLEWRTAEHHFLTEKGAAGRCRQHVDSDDDDTHELERLLTDEQKPSVMANEQEHQSAPLGANEAQQSNTGLHAATGADGTAGSDTEGSAAGSSTRGDIVRRDRTDEEPPDHIKQELEGLRQRVRDLESQLVETEAFFRTEPGDFILTLERDLAETKLRLSDAEAERDELEVRLMNLQGRVANETPRATDNGGPRGLQWLAARTKTKSLQDTGE